MATGWSSAHLEPPCDQAGDPIYQVSLTPDFHPWRRNLDFVPIVPADIRPLLPKLTFTRSHRNWEIVFRHGSIRPNPRFVEWLMGLNEGWVASPELGLTDAEQVTALGNGVLPVAGGVGRRTFALVLAEVRTGSRSRLIRPPEQVARFTSRLRLYSGSLA